MIYFIAVFAVSFGVSLIVLLFIGAMYRTVRLEANPRLAGLPSVEPKQVRIEHRGLDTLRPDADAGNFHPFVLGPRIQKRKHHDQAA